MVGGLSLRDMFSICSPEKKTSNEHALTSRNIYNLLHIKMMAGVGITANMWTTLIQLL